MPKNQKNTKGGEQYPPSPSKLIEELRNQTRFDVSLASRPESRLTRVRVQHAGHVVVLQERAGGADIQLELGRRAQDRRSSGTTDWIEALAAAERHLRQLVLNDVIDQEIPRAVPGSDPPISTVIDYYVARRFGAVKAKQGRRKQKYDTKLAPDLVSPAHARRVDRVFAIVEHLYGPHKPLSFFDKQFVRAYVTHRTTRTIMFPERFARRPCRPASTKTAIGELKDFAGTIEYALKNDVIAANPLQGYAWDAWLEGDDHAVEHMEEAHVQRYRVLMSRPTLLDPASKERLLAPVDRIAAADGGARLRCFVALLFHTAHRPTSVHALNVEDIALTREEMIAALADAPNHRTWWADHWPYGAVFWRKSKRNYRRVTPLSRAMRLEIDRWREAHPDWRPGVPLFPAITDPTKRVAETSLREWMRKAIEIARTDLVRQHVPQQDIERWLSGTLLYGFRSLWATLMDQLGYGWTAAEQGMGGKLDLHKHVSFYGDWAVGGGTMDVVYAKLNPDILLAVAEFERAAEVVERFSRVASDDVAEALSAVYDEGDVIPINRFRGR